MHFIDTHTHIYDIMFDTEEDEVISRAREAGVDILLQPDVDSRERDRMLALTERYPGVLYPMLGLYPGSVEADWRDEYDKLLSKVDSLCGGKAGEHSPGRVVAIGEIGLDYHYNKDFAEEQKEVLRLQLELAASLSLPVNIHLREATEDFFSVLEDCRHLGLRGNLHAFSGSWETFSRMERYGDWYAGIGGVVTFKKASLAQTVAKMPMDRILLETDSPYLTPAPYRGKRNESMYIPIIAAKVAELKGISLEEVAETTTANARKLFSI